MYNQLYTKSVYSLLKSSLKIEDYVKQAKAFQMTSLALTDHTSVYGLIQFYKTCKKYDLKPILGITLTTEVCDVICLAKNNKGYQNILKLSTIAKLYPDTPLPKAKLIEYQQDLIVMIPTRHNLIEYQLQNQQFEELKVLFSDFKQNIKSLYIGIHPAYDNQNNELNQKVNYLANLESIPLVALNEVRYFDQEDQLTLRYLEAIRTGEKIGSHMFNLYPDYAYLHQPDEFESLFKGYEAAILNTIKIVELCDVQLNFDQLFLPKYETKGNVSSDDYIKALCVKGLKKRLNLNQIPTVYKERLKYELDVIAKMQFSDYFLIVYDFVKYAKSKGILVGPGRGSAAGSLVAYVLGITNVDPIHYHLLFERFLNPERISMPDIDLDFEDTRRDEVIKYVQRKYGKYHMAHIIAFGTFGTRSAIREVAKVMSITDTRLNEILSYINGMLSIDANLEASEPLRLLVEEFSEIRKLFELAKKIEGIPRNTTTHAAGIIMSNEPLTEYTALQIGLNDVLQTQYEAKDIESLGLIKMDFLGIRNLSMITKMLQLIKQVHGIELDLNHIPLDDAKTFRLIAKGETAGIFQLESEGMRNVLREMEAKTFEDIVAVNALFRPGPMDNINLYIKRKKGEAPIEYLHDDLIPILKPTYGIIVYQEQVMQIVQKVANYSLGKADLLRRAIGKKMRQVLEEERIVFTMQAIKNGYQEETASELYDYIVKFGDYGFNRSHSVAYSMISYQLAYLKANYLTLFMSVLLSSVIGSESQTAKYIQDCKRYGIKILPVSINKSHNNYIIENNNSIRMSLLSLKGLGQSIADGLNQERTNGSFRSFFDFVSRTKGIVKQNVFQSLVYSGALDEFRLTKKAMIENYDKVMDFIRFNPSGYFNDQIEFKTSDEFDRTTLMHHEKSILGFYLTTHPIRDYLNSIEKKDFILPSESINHQNKQVEMIAFIENSKEVVTKNKDLMATLMLSDDLISLPGVIFPREYQTLGKSIMEHKLYRFKGKINERNQKLQLIIQDVTIIE